jgi:hypothetical protein
MSKNHFWILFYPQQLICLYRNKTMTQSTTFFTITSSFYGAQWGHLCGMQGTTMKKSWQMARVRVAPISTDGFIDSSCCALSLHASCSHLKTPLATLSDAICFIFSRKTSILHGSNFKRIFSNILTPRRQDIRAFASHVWKLDKEVVSPSIRKHWKTLQVAFESTPSKLTVTLHIGATCNMNKVAFVAILLAYAVKTNSSAATQVSHAWRNNIYCLRRLFKQMRSCNFYWF